MGDEKEAMTNRTALDEQLATELADLLIGTKRSAVAVARRAADLKADFFDETTKRYDSDFKVFWRDHGMVRRFGTLSNFTKYANAGIAIGQMPSAPEGVEDRYPTSLLALYELSMLTPEELALCLENTYSRGDVTDDRSQWKIPEPPIPLIAPATTARAIAKWKQAWRYPQPEPEEAPESILVAKLHAFRFDGSDEDEDWEKRILKQFKDYIAQFSGMGRLGLEIIHTPLRYVKRDPELGLGDHDKDAKWAARIKKAFVAELVSPTKKLKFRKSLGQLLRDLGFTNWSISGTNRKNGRVEKGGYIFEVRPSDYRMALAEEYLKINGTRAFLNHLYRHDRLDPTLLSKEEKGALIYLETRYRELSKITSALRKPQNAELRDGVERLDEMEAEVGSIETALPAKISSLPAIELDELAASYVPNIVQFGWKAWQPKTGRGG
jgi:hypothetical protein